MSTPNPKTLRQEVAEFVRQKRSCSKAYMACSKVYRGELREEMLRMASRYGRDADSLQAILDRTRE